MYICKNLDEFVLLQSVFHIGLSVFALSAKYNFIVSGSTSECNGGIETLADLWYQVWGKGPREGDGPPTGGPACSLGGNDGHEVNRRPGVGAVHLQQIKTGWPHGANKQDRVKNKGQKLMKSPGNERRSERGGVSLSGLWRSKLH